MKLIVLGTLDEVDVDELRHQPVALLTGSIEEIRSAAPLLFAEVVLRKRKAKTMRVSR